MGTYLVMSRIRIVPLVVVVFLVALLALGLAAAVANGSGREGPPSGQSHDHDDDDGDRDDDDDDRDDDDDDDRGAGITLERAPIAGLGPAKVRYVPGELLVRFRAGTSDAEARGAAARAGGKVIGRIAALGIRVVGVPPSRTQSALASLRSEPSVQSVERDILLKGLDTIPNDVLWPTQWGLRLVGAPRAWDATRGDSAVVIAVLDTGLDASHRDLAGAVLPGRDVVNNDPDAADDQGHGTSVGGVIAARTNNGDGQAGVCWACSLLPVKVLAADGSGKTSTVAAGIVWAADHGARVINMSLGSPGGTSALSGAVAYAAKKNAVLVAAAGNSGVDTPFYPAGYGDVISVAATTESDGRYSWSNHGDWVKVAAPGCNAAPKLGGGYVEFCGTSSASPIVAGIAGLAVSLRPTASRIEIEQALEQNVVSVPGVVRFGRLKAPEAMSAVSPSALPPPPPPPAAPSPPPAAPAPSGTAAPRMVRRPRLLGRARIGRKLRVSPGSWTPAPTQVAYQWRRCRRNGTKCRNIRGARSRSYRLRLADRGRRLRAVVVAINAGGSASAITGASAVARRAQ